MVQKLLTALVVRLLAHKELTGECKSRVTSALLKNVHALPLRGTLFIDNLGAIYLNGKKMPSDQVHMFKNSAKAVKDSLAFRIIVEQTRFLAIEMGTFKAQTPEQIEFGKAALWYASEQIRMLEQITGESYTQSSFDEQ
jgi:hypothetical protein